MRIFYAAVEEALSSIEYGLREKLKLENIALRKDLIEFVVLSDDETFSRAVNFCRLYSDWILATASFPHETSYVAFYVSRYAPILREYIKGSERLWNTVIDVLKLVDLGKPFSEAVKSVEIDRNIIELLRRVGPIYLYEDGYTKAVLLFPSPNELKDYAVSDHMLAEHIISSLLGATELSNDSIKLPNGYVYRPSNPFELFTRLLHVKNDNVNKNVQEVLKNAVKDNISKIVPCDDMCSDKVVNVCTNIGMACDVDGTIRFFTEFVENSRLKINVELWSDYLRMKGSVVVQDAVAPSTLLDAVKKLTLTMISYADKIQSWMKVTSAKPGIMKGVNVDKNLRVEIGFENVDVQENGLTISIPRKAIISFNIFTKYVPDRLLKEALSKFDVNVSVQRERERLNVKTTISGHIEVSAENIESALNKVLEIRDAVDKARQEYRERVARKRPFKSVDEAIAAYLNFVSSPLYSIVKKTSLAVEPGTVLTSMQTLLMQSGKHTAKTIRELYKKHGVNPLLASPQAIVVALIKDGVLDVSDHVYIRGRDIEDIIRGSVDNPAEVEAKIREFMLTDVLIYAAEKKEYEIIARMRDYVTKDLLEKVVQHITPLIAIRLLDSGVSDESAKNILIQKILASGSPRQKTYVVYKYLRGVLRGVPNISLGVVDKEYVIDAGAFYVQIDSVSRDSVTIIAYRKDTKIGFKFSGSTFREALRNATLNYDAYLDKLQRKSSDELTVVEITAEKSAEENAELASA